MKAYTIIEKPFIVYHILDNFKFSTPLRGRTNSNHEK